MRTAALLRWADLSVFIGPLGKVDFHRHRAPALLLALDRPLQVCSEGGEAEVIAAWIPPRLLHALDGRNQPVAVLYFDPLYQRRSWPRGLQLGCGKTAWARRAQRRLQDHSADWECRAQQQRFAAAMLDELLPELGAWQRMGLADPRVLAAGERLATAAWPYSIRQAAKAVRLSPGRFAHLFRAEAGLSWAAYHNWTRLIAASSDLARQPRSLTALSADFGYASPAHFSAAFRQAFGLRPSVLAGLAPHLHRHRHPAANF